MLNIRCDVIHDVIDKRLTDLIDGATDSFESDWLQLLQYVCGIHVVGNEMTWSTFYAPPCIN